MTTDIQTYNQALPPEWQGLADDLAREIAAALPDAAARIYHGAPVWFLADNPLVGYWLRKDHLQLLFWSGQSFPTPGLTAEGKFKAAELRLKADATLDRDMLGRWLADARAWQWDYKNIVKRKGVLEWLTRPAEG